MRLILTIAYIILSTVGFAQRVQVNLLPSYNAGEPIRISCQGITSSAQLVAKHSYGLEIVRSDKSSNSVHYNLPIAVSQKKGIIDITIFDHNKEIWTGSTRVLADTAGTHSIEAFCGPKHLVVGKGDFSMVTSSVLDVYDNPYPEDSKFNINELINNTLKSNNIIHDDLLGFKRIYAPSNSGHGAVSVTYETSSTKEFRLDFYSNEPINYTITSKRQHNFADGNQIIKFSTSIIKDAFQNIIENGTTVYFYIHDSQKRLSIGTAQTMSGIAHFSLPAPIQSTTWTVKSVIANYSSSKEISLSFKPSFLEVPIEITSDSLVVGPVIGFMKQFVKDGTLLKLELVNASDTLQYAYPVKAGMVYVNWKRDLVPLGSYDIDISIGDFKKNAKATIDYE